MVKVIAFLNFKGGVGKTSNTVNIGACLAQEFDKKVLIVDLDPQASSTFWLMHRERFNELINSEPSSQIVRQSSYGLFQGYIEGSTTIFDLSETGHIPGHPFPHHDHLHLVPSCYQLMTAEAKLMTNLLDINSMLLLEKQLRPEVGDYDYVLIDCPPNFYSMTRNAVCMADRVVVPFNPDMLAIAGIRHLARMLSQLSLMVGNLSNKSLTSLISGCIFNLWRNTLENRQALNALEENIGILRNEGLVSPNCQILEPYIPMQTVVGEAPDNNTPLPMYRPNCQAAELYRELTKSLIENL